MDRRNFLAGISCSLASVTTAPIFRLQAQSPRCWLDVCSPFIVEDAERGIQSEIVLTSDTFAGPRGHEDGREETEYEILLYDATGKEATKTALTVQAMRTTVIPARRLIAGAKSFWGGMRIRLRPNSHDPSRRMTHSSDLFSSAFVRWQTVGSFDNVHANPDPLQWQNTESYFYSMPFPSLDEYDCVFSLFNPNEQRSAGEIAMHDPNGKRIATQRFELKPHASLLFDLNAGSLIHDPWQSGKTNGRASGQGGRSGRSGRSGMLAAINEPGTAKSFGYLMIRQRGRDRFSVEHPIHQGVFKPKPAVEPFDAGKQFKAKNVLYTPLLFHAKRIGNLTFDSRFHFGTGLPLEESQWFYPFAVDGAGEAVWQSTSDAKLPQALSAQPVQPVQVNRGAIRLAAGQSCVLDFQRLSLEPGFAGGLGVAVSPDTTHTLLKVELRVREWGAHAFTHFRPGLRSARAYQKPKARGGLATDYVVSGAKLVKTANSLELDELIAVLNIDDRGLAARPVLELFSSKGMLHRIPLGEIPPFACRHFLLSELIEGDADYGPMTMRLLDENATLLMSAVHLDFARRDLALDHGSDRFSTFLDYGCQ